MSNNRYVSVNFRIRDETTVYLCIECHVCELILTLTDIGTVQVRMYVGMYLNIGMI